MTLSMTGENIPTYSSRIIIKRVEGENAPQLDD
jgi:hypothetical protein